LPRYLVERTFAEPLKAPVADRRAAHWAGVVRINADAGVTWLHSYASDDGRRTFCIYEGPSPEAVRRAAARNGLPIDRIPRVRVLDRHLPMNQEFPMRSPSVLPLALLLACSDSSPSAAGASDAGLDAGCASPTWGTSLTRIDGNDPQNNGFPHVGFDAAGNAVAIWERADLGASTSTIWSATRRGEGAWSAPVQIDQTSGMTAPPHARLAVAAGGTAVAVWEQQTSATYALPYAAVYDGSTWGAPALLHPDVQPTQGGGGLEPRVAILPDGDAIVAFAFDDGAPDSSHPDFGQQIYVARRTAGSWRPPGRLSTFDGTYQESTTPDVAMAGTGDAVVVWDQTFVQNQPGDGDRVLVTRVAAGSAAPSGQALVDAAGSVVGKTPVVGVDGGSNATVVWIEHQSTAMTYASRIAAGSLQGVAAQLDASAPGPNAAEARVAVDANGGVTAVWRETANDPRAIWASRFVAGSWTGAVALETAAAEASNPALALDDRGDAMGVCETGAGIKASIFALAVGSWGAPVVLDPSAIGSSNADVAFVHGCTQALVVWSEATGQSGGNGAGIDSAPYR
jgi:hypothetical protein